ncbi:MAG: deoxyhypusine synthase family protein [Deltaproteobacteria bacterium]|nr:deoxyhypusine synthase family protein [Deltaproteobacteria bacterium]
MKQKKCPNKDKYLSGKRILPKGLTGRESIEEMINNTFLAYNGARLREGCNLYTKKMLEEDVTVGMSLAGALTPAGLGAACIVPLIKAGFVDWMVATGANMYHDLHFAFNFPLHVGSHLVDDADLRKNDVVRIYDVLLGYTDCLMTTDEILRSILIGMNMAGVELKGNKLRINPSIDVNETTSFVLAAKRDGGKSGVLLVGGGSPKNFMLQTEPQIQEVLRIKEVGQDYFFQVTDARPDTGGLSGATPHEAVSWGKVDPNRLPDAVVSYVDATVALPIITHYALSTHKKRKLKNLYFKRDDYMKRLVREYFAHNK